jgi:predicted tellurium resistance membrane protein TerC
MASLLTLLRNSLLVTSLDLDNALYMTSVVDQVTPRKKQQQLIFWGLIIEYLGRLLLILFFQYVINGNQPLFELFGFPISIESISLIAAGLFLTIRSGRELLAHLRGGNEAEVAASDIEGKSFTQILAQMSVVCLTLSIDTIVAVMASGQSLTYLALVLFLSGLIRFFFIYPISRFLQKYPNVNFIVLTFLIIIGVSLFFEGFGTELPQELTNTVMAMVTLVVIFIEHQRARSRHNKRLKSWEKALQSTGKDDKMTDVHLGNQKAKDKIDDYE